MTELGLFFIEILNGLALIVLAAVTWLFGSLLHSLWFLKRRRGIERGCHALAALCSLHLLAGLGLAFSGTAPGVLLSALYSSWVLCLSGLTLLVMIFLPISARNALTLPEGPEGERIKAQAEGLERSRQVFLALAWVLILAGVSLWTSHQERQSLKTRLCADVRTHSPEVFLNRANQFGDLVDRRLGTDLRHRVKCPTEGKT